MMKILLGNTALLASVAASIPTFIDGQSRAQAFWFVWCACVILCLSAKIFERMTK